MPTGMGLDYRELKGAAPHRMKTLSGVCSGRALAVAFLLVALAIPARGQVRVVAIGDVHGAYEEFVSILQHAGLIDQSRHWAGGATLFVQTGDIPDRGPQSRQALDLLIELEREAPQQNGKVIPLLGNHEVMNMMGDLRYVSSEDYQNFASDQSEKVRDQAYQDYLKFLSARKGSRRVPSPDDEAARQSWMDAHPLGFFERWDAFSPQGVYGRWLRQHDVVAQVDDGLFMHGGLDPKLRFRNIRELNDRAHKELAGFDSIWQSLSDKKIIWRYMTLVEAVDAIQKELTAVQSGGQLDDPVSVEKMQNLLGFQQWLIVATDGPLWYRGLAIDAEPNLNAGLEKMLARLKVQYLVVGHTVQQSYTINPRFNDHVFLIDTGMLKQVFRGRGSALEIQGGHFTAYYSDGGHVVLVGSGGGAVPAQGHSRGPDRGREHL